MKNFQPRTSSCYPCAENVPKIEQQVQPQNRNGRGKPQVLSPSVVSHAAISFVNNSTLVLLCSPFLIIDSHEAPRVSFYTLLSYRQARAIVRIQLRGDRE